MDFRKQASGILSTSHIHFKGTKLARPDHATVAGCTVMTLSISENHIL